MSKVCDPECLANLCKYTTNVIASTTAPIKFLVAIQLLKLSEETNQWDKIPEANTLSLIKNLKQVIKFHKDEESKGPEANSHESPQKIIEQAEIKDLEKRTK